MLLKKEIELVRLVFNGIFKTQGHSTGIFVVIPDYHNCYDVEVSDEVKSHLRKKGVEVGKIGPITIKNVLHKSIQINFESAQAVKDKLIF